MRLPFWPAAVALTAFMTGAQIYSALQENQTFDEGVHLMAGYSYLITGDFRMNVEHPPLAKLLCALPLLALRPHFPTEDPAWQSVDSWVLADSFLYHNGPPADRMLLLGRLVTIAISAIFALGFALWTRRRFGEPVALLALFLLALDSNFLAHGRYVTTDLLAAATFFVTVVAWGRYLERGRKRDLAIAGVAFGLALTSKYSMVILGPLLVILYVLKWCEREGRLSLWHMARSLTAVGVLAWAVVLVAYAPQLDTLRVVYKLRRMLHPHQDDGPPPQLLARTVDSTPVGKLFGSVGLALQLPAHPWLMGLYSVASHNQEGHQTYLLGRQSDKGVWYYFPVIFAVKTPTAVLFLLLVALGIAVWRARSLPFRWLLLVVPAVVYFAFAMTSGINLGVRHLLPIYPPLFVLIAAAVIHAPLSRRWIAAIVALACAVHVYELARVHPYYLSFFNTLSGGPERGSYYALDSNIDWGQDLKRFGAWLKRNRIDRPCVLYFGRAPMHYYGISDLFLPPKPDPTLDCLVAASVTPLRGVYVSPGDFEWLRAMKPTGRIGYSIYLFDLRRNRTAAPALMN